MSQTPSTRALADSLERLEAGQRVWFWCSPDVESAHPPLLIRSFADDTGMEQLRADAAQIPLPLGGLQCIGAGHVGEDGTLQLGGPLVEASMLTRVASWVRDNVSESPGLARLHSAKFLTVKSGKIVSTHQDDTLWEGVPRPVVPGSRAHAAQVFAQLPVGGQAWFWLLQHGPGGDAFLLLHPQESDPSGEAFSALARSVMLRSPGETGVSIRGVLQRRAAWPALSTADTIDGWRDVLSEVLAAQPDLSGLSQARMILLMDGAIHRVEALDTASAPTPAPAPTSAAGSGPSIADIVVALEEGKVSFWLGDTASGVEVLLDTDRDALRARVPSGAADAVRGQARLSKEGWVEFRSRTDDKTFLPRLVQWFHRNSGTEGIELFHGSRFIVMDGKTEVARYEDDGAWT